MKVVAKDQQARRLLRLGAVHLPVLRLELLELEQLQAGGGPVGQDDEGEEER